MVCQRSKKIFLFRKTSLFLLALWVSLGAWCRDWALAQYHVHIPLLSNEYCTKDLVFLSFGDSITGCYMDSNMCAFPQCGYPKRLYDGLKARMDRSFAFYNVGLGGERTADGLARIVDTVQRPGVYNASPFFCAAAPSNFYPSASTNTQPDLILIMEGTNDAGDWAANGVPSLEKAEANIRAMVLRSLQSGIKVVLATLTPVVPINDHRALQGQGVALLSDGIRRIAAEYQVPLADVFSFFINHPDWENQLMSTDLAGDGLHPNDLGFAVMAEVFYRTVITHIDSAGCYK
jgi:lysophospholipase L1-like esterase